MYHAIRVTVKNGSPLYDYSDQVTRAANNLYNATVYRIRQVMTAMGKDPSVWQPNEKAVMNEIRVSLPAMNEVRTKNNARRKERALKEGKEFHAAPLFKLPTAEKWMLSYTFLDCLFKVSQNPDYQNAMLSRQTVQNTIKSACQDMKAFVAGSKAYHQDPHLFTGKPKLPRYKKKGGNCTVSFTNQDCKLIEHKDGKFYLQFPLTKLRCCFGKPACTKLKQVTIHPMYGIFVITIVTDDGKTAASPAAEPPRRTCHIDFGVNNLAAITNNIGKPCLLFQGGVVKSANHWYNKRLATIQSEQTKGSTKKFIRTPEVEVLCRKRDAVIGDFMHKVGKNIVNWCVNNQIDTLVMGINKGWKQEVNMGKQNNQNFVQIPFFRLQNILRYLCERAGIRILEQEESYTSKASFLDQDSIPVYGTQEDEIHFSGKRAPSSYKGMHRKNGFRGLYQSKDGTIINSDLNGSANIGRKALPNIFVDGVAPDFQSVIIISHPDFLHRKENHAKQHIEKKEISKSKQRRQMRRAKKCNPIGI